MAQPILKLKRGLSSNLPAAASAGEPLLTMDTKELYVGQGDGQPLLKISGDADLLQGKDLTYFQRNIEIGTVAPANPFEKQLWVDTSVAAPYAFKTYVSGAWQEIAQADVAASEVSFTPQGDITSTTVQDAIVEVASDASTKADAAETAAKSYADTEVAAEATARQAGDAAVQAEIAALKDGSDKTIADLVADDATEKSRAEAAEAALQTAIDTLSASTSTNLEDYVKHDGSVAFTGDINAGGNQVSNVGLPQAGTDAVNKDYIDGLIQGLSWEEPVAAKADVEGDIASPVNGERYVIGAQLMTYNGSAFVAETIEDGSAVWCQDTDELLVFNGTTFVKFGSTINHETQLGLQGGIDGEHYHLTSAQHVELTTNTYNKQAVDGLVAGVSAEVATEKTRAEAAEAALQTAIDNEIAAREAAITSEASARSTADAGLQSQIDTVTANLGAKTLGGLSDVPDAYINNSILAVDASGNIVFDTVIDGGTF